MNMSIAQYRAVQNRVVKAHREMEIAEMNLRFSEADLRLRVMMHVSPSGGTITLKFDEAVPMSSARELREDGGYELRE